MAREAEGGKGSSGPCLRPSLSASMTGRLSHTVTLYVYLSIYTLSTTDLWFFSSPYPFFFKHIQKYLKAPPSSVFTGSLSNPSFP